MTAKITTEPLTENYQQAGLRVYQDDNNWASVHMIYAGGSAVTSSSSTRTTATRATRRPTSSAASRPTLR